MKESDHELSVGLGHERPRFLSARYIAKQPYSRAELVVFKDEVRAMLTLAVTGYLGAGQLAASMTSSARASKCGDGETDMTSLMSMTGSSAGRR